MKTTGAYKIWRIIYPIGIYYVVSSLAYFFLTLLLGAGEESYMLRQMLCAAATIPFVWMHYGQDRAARETVYGRRGIRPDAKFFCTVAGALLAGASLGMAVNNVIAMTPLIEASAGFQSANQAFFAGGVVFELLGSCLVIPLAEELLYRGVVERRLSLLCGSAPAIVLSAVIFGVMHWNVVQFLYAGIWVCCSRGCWREPAFCMRPFWRISGECDGGCAQRDRLAGHCLPAHGGRCYSDGAAVCGGSVCGSAGEKGRSAAGRGENVRCLKP